MSMTRRHFLGLSAAFAAMTGPSLAAQAAPNLSLQYAVLDYETGEELLTSKAHTKRHPASLTKVMALYVVMETMNDPKIKFNLESIVEMPFINMRGGLAAFKKIKKGGDYKAKDLLIGAGSRSDAKSITALAVHTAKLRGGAKDKDYGQNRFVGLMNKAAKNLGMKDTHFSVITGRPEKSNYSTPADIAKLMIAMERRFPKLSELAMGQTSFNISSISFGTRHTNSLVYTQPGTVRFAKTGYTIAAGHCLATYSVVNGRKLTSVVLGGKSNGECNIETLRILKEAAKKSVSHKPETKPVTPLPPIHHPVIEAAQAPTPRMRPHGL